MIQAGLNQCSQKGDSDAFHGRRIWVPILKVKDFVKIRLEAPRLPPSGIGERGEHRGVGKALKRPLWWFPGLPKHLRQTHDTQRELSGQYAAYIPHMYLAGN